MKVLVGLLWKEDGEPLRVGICHLQGLQFRGLCWKFSHMALSFGSPFLAMGSCIAQMSWDLGQERSGVTLEEGLGAVMVKKNK